MSYLVELVYWIIGVIFALLLSSCAGIPAQYDLGDHPDAFVTYLNPHAVDDRCAEILGSAGKRRVWFGCAWRGDNEVRCNVILPPFNNPELRRHEMAHCWGWRH